MHLVGLFQPVSTFVLAVAAGRINEYDTSRGYSVSRRAWLERRHVSFRARQRASFQQIYIDDGIGATILEEKEELAEQLLEGSWDAVACTLDPPPPAEACRADVHLAIVMAPFREARWPIASGKVQRGSSIDYLGFEVVATSAALPQGGETCMEANRQGLFSEIKRQQTAARRVPFRWVE